MFASRHTALGIALLLPALAAGCRSATVASEPPVQPAAGAPIPRTADAVPAGTMMRGSLNQGISTESSRVGDRFTVTVLDPLVAENGEVAIPAGTVVSGTVAALDPSDHVGEQASVVLRFDTIAVGGRAVPIDAMIAEADVKQSREGSGVAKGAGAGALGGALLGAILGGGSGALKGGLVGAGAGTVISLGAGDVQAELPAGTVVTLRIESPVMLR